VEGIYKWCGGGSDTPAPGANKGSTIIIVKFHKHSLYPAWGECIETNAPNSYPVGKLQHWNSDEQWWKPHQVIKPYSPDQNGDIDEDI